MKLRRLLLLLTCLTGTKCGKYVLPNVKIEALESGGLKASIPVHPREKLELFSFDANVNRKIRSWEKGTISGSTTIPVEGRWTVIDRNAKLNLGDKIQYWIFAQSGRYGYERENLEFVVKEFVRNIDDCEKSISTFDKDEPLCKDEIIFEDDFTSNVLNKNIWEVHNYIPTYLQDYGDNEFVSYENNEDNLLIGNGFLTLRPKARSVRIDELDLSSKCTFSRPNEGLQKFACKLVRYQPGRRPQDIIPPVITSRISSKKSFKYGKIEIKAKLSKGDWIVPQAVLLPSDYKYGPGYKSGALYAVYSRGNENITVGWGGVSYGPVLNTDKAKNLKTFVVDEGFHTYKMEWTPSGSNQWIDNVLVHTENITMIGYRSKIYFTDSLGTWTNSPSGSAPFDQNFQLHLTVSVGGNRDFQDIVKKPWVDGGIKSVIDFERDRDNWLKTWVNHTDFVIDYVKVSAL